VTGIPKTIGRAGRARSDASRAGYPVLLGHLVALYALSNVARAGATRSGYTSPATFITIDGVHYGTGRSGTPGVLAESLTIQDQLNETPNTATMTVVGFVPVDGQEVIVTVGSKNNARREFAGHILSSRLFYQETPRNYQVALNLIDYQWGLDVKKVRARFTATTVSAIAASLMATYAPNTYTLIVYADIAGAKIDEITFTEQDLTQCLTQLVKRVGGAWYCDYQRAVRLFFTDTTGTPPTLINAVHPTLMDFEKTLDLSQTISRQYVEGGGSTAAADVVVGETLLPVVAPEWYEPTGGVVVSGPQRITYTGVATGGTGGLVGPGASPSAAPTLALAAGTGVQSGAHTYAVTFKTAAGETIAGPQAAITCGPIDGPTVGPTFGSPQAGAGPDPGSHDYAVTFVTATGETTPGPRTTYVTATTAAPGAPSPMTPQAPAGVDQGSHDYAMTCVTATGETTPSPISGAVTVALMPGPTKAPLVSQYNDGTGYGLEAGWQIGDTMQLCYTYSSSSTDLTKNSAYSPTAQFVLLQHPVYSADTIACNVTVYAPINPGVARIYLWLKNLTRGEAFTIRIIYQPGGYWNGNADGAGVPPQNIWNFGHGNNLLPAPNDVWGTINVNLALGPSETRSRKLYRRSGGAGLRLAQTIGDNTTTHVLDQLPNASLGAAPPSTNTAALQQVTVSGIPSGGALVTSKRVYRTAANASALQLLTTLPATTSNFVDGTPDSGLGAAAPSVSTAQANRVQLSGIPIGAASVTGRVLYRTQAGLTALKLLATLGDNSTTSYLDAISDGALGVAPPISDTSGLTQPGSAQVPPGSTTLPVANIGAFLDAGGWAIIGNGDQVIRYHGKAGSTLTGIPASGPGAIVAAISWNSTVTASAMLTGIPASGAGSILVALIKGDEINLFVQVDDLNARAAIAQFLGTDGIIEDYMQDRRLSHREAVARGTAQLATKNQVRTEIRYKTRDLNVRTGRLQQVYLVAPPWSLNDSFLIQSVTEHPHAYHLMPTFEAVASNARFTFDEFLRLIHDEVT
jgi:hypothetical protein